MESIFNKGRSAAEAARHKLICDICKLVETKLSTQEILNQTPIDYGTSITYDHLNYLFDRTYDRLAKFSYASLVVIHLIWLLKPARKESSI
jgi:hypothetical protein